MFDRPAVVAWYRRNRERSRAIFDLLVRDADAGDDVDYCRPIALRHPIVFYEGHLAAFSFNTLVKRALGGRGIDERLERLFARGIDPHEATADGSSDVSDGPASSHQRTPSHADEDSRGAGEGPRHAGWPTREEVQAFTAEADRRVLEALCREDLERPGHPLLDRADAVFTILEHEAMHQETLLYMWHRLPPERKRRPAGYLPRDGRGTAVQEWVHIGGGPATLGLDRDSLAFGWDNESPRHVVNVAPFSIDRFSVTNAQFLEFVDAGGYADGQWWRREDRDWIQREGISHPLFWEHGAEGRRGRTGGESTAEWHWRGMFDRLPLPLSWPVYVSHAEAAAYARWRGARLPTEAEYQRATFGSPEGERPHPWGSAGPSAEHGVFDFSSWDPEPVGSHPAGQSAWGAEDLVGNGWEWTSSVFGPFPGFRPSPSYPEYSADFFDGEHMVMKGASPATAAELLRPTFRNWFRARYPYVYAKFRCVRG